MYEIWKHVPLRIRKQVAVAHYSDAADGLMVTINGETPCGVALSAMGYGNLRDPDPGIFTQFAISREFASTSTWEDLSLQAAKFIKDWEEGVIGPGDLHEALGLSTDNNR